MPEGHLAVSRSTGYQSRESFGGLAAVRAGHRGLGGVREGLDGGEEAF